MTYETYLNLVRVQDKRIRQGRITGNWTAVREAIA